MKGRMMPRAIAAVVVLSAFFCLGHASNFSPATTSAVGWSAGHRALLSRGGGSDGDGDNNDDGSKRKKLKNFAGDAVDKFRSLPVISALVASYLVGRRRGGSGGDSDGDSIWSPAKKAIGSLTSSSKSRPVGTIAFFVTLFAVREFWGAIPVWLKLQLPLIERTPLAGSSDGSDGSGFSDLNSLSDKFQSILEKASDRTPPASSTRPAFLTLVKLNSKLRSEYGEKRDRQYEESGKNVQGGDVLQGMDEVFELADLAYDDLPEGQSLPEALEEMGYQLIRHEKVPVPGNVDHFVAIHKQKKRVVISVKGTSDFEEMLTDLCAQPVSHRLDGPFVPGGQTEIHCHEGVIEASKKLADFLSVFIEELVLPSDYSLLLTGHSLGGGVATLCALILRSRFPQLLRDSNGNRLEAITFGTPPVLDCRAALACRPFVTSVVNNSDAIPRASLNNAKIMVDIVRSMSDRLGEKKLLPTGIPSTIRFFRTLSRDEEESIMSVEEVQESIAASQDGIDLYDSDHLFCPGRVVHLYDLWSKAEYENEGEDGDNDDDDGDDDGDDGDDQSEGSVRTAERVSISDGTSKVLCYVEIDSRMVTDHLRPSYRNSIHAMVSK